MNTAPNVAHTPEDAQKFIAAGEPYYELFGGEWHLTDPTKTKPVLTVVPTADDSAASGWDVGAIHNEAEQLKVKLAQVGVMTDAQIQAEIEKQSNFTAAQVQHAIKKKLSNPNTLDMEALVELELLILRSKEEAKRRYRTENTDADLSLFDGCLSLTAALQARYELPEWRVRGLLRVGHITTVAGPAKSGKTSLLVNRVKSFADGTPLFGEYEMHQKVEGNIGVWNFELTPGQQVDWFRKADIRNTDKVMLVNARGAGLYIQNDLVVERAIEWIKRNNIEVLEIDPLQAAYIGSVSDDKDAAAYISALQYIQKESGVKDIILTTHMGHAAKTNVEAQRSIGSARWEGFPDNQWIFGREIGKPATLRIDRGRDVFLDEIGLVMDEETKILTKVFVPKPIDENWNAMLRMLKDGQAHKKADVKEANGTTTANKSAIIKHIDWLRTFGLIEEYEMKALNKKPTDAEEAKSYVPEYDRLGQYGQKTLFVRLNEVGCRLLNEETEKTPLPTRLWFEEQGLEWREIDKGR